MSENMEKIILENEQNVVWSKIKTQVEGSLNSYHLLNELVNIQVFETEENIIIAVNHVEKLVNGFLETDRLEFTIDPFQTEYMDSFEIIISWDGVPYMMKMRNDEIMYDFNSIVKALSELEGKLYVL